MTGISTLGQALLRIDNLNTQQQRLSDLSTQLASGKKTQSYSGLNTDALTSIRSRTELGAIETYITNITRSDTTIQLTLNAVEEFKAQSEQFSSTLFGFVQEGSHQTGDNVLYDDPATPAIEEIIVGNTSATSDNDLQSVVNHANNLFDFLGDLVNAQQNDRYLLAGADGATQPYNDTGTLDAAINTLITDWKNGTISTEDLIADITDRSATNGNPDALTDTIIGYSSSLSEGTQGRVFVRVDERSEVDFTITANEDSLRNMMVALAVIKNENFTPIVDVYEDGNYPGTPDVQGAPGTTAEEQQDNFYQLYSELTRIVSDSVDGIDSIRFRTETVRVQMNETKEAHQDQQQLLLTTISDIEDVDINEVAVQITSLQTQLQASYTVTALTQQLTLVNFL